MEHIRTHLWHRYSVPINQVMMATVNFRSDDLNLTSMNPLHNSPSIKQHMIGTTSSGISDQLRDIKHVQLNILIKWTNCEISNYVCLYFNLDLQQQPINQQLILDIDSMIFVHSKADVSVYPMLPWWTLTSHPRVILTSAIMMATRYVQQITGQGHSLLYTGKVANYILSHFCGWVVVH